MCQLSEARHRNTGLAHADIITESSVRVEQRRVVAVAHHRQARVEIVAVRAQHPDDRDLDGHLVLGHQRAREVGGLNDEVDGEQRHAVASERWLAAVVIRLCVRKLGLSHIDETHPAATLRFMSRAQPIYSIRHEY